MPKLRPRLTDTICSTGFIGLWRGGSSSGGGAKHIGGIWEAPFATSKKGCDSYEIIAYVKIYYAQTLSGSDITGTFRIDADCPKFYRTTGTLSGVIAGRQIRLVTDKEDVYSLKLTNYGDDYDAMVGKANLSGEELKVLFRRPR
jgi:hypothetical protein